MKKIFLLLSFSSLIAWGYTQNDVNHANYLAQGNIVVDQSADPTKYRLDDSILRQEIIGMMMKSHKGPFLLQDYTCKGYYSDAIFNSQHRDAWVCRAAEMAADDGIISRENKRLRPRDSVTRAEALAMIVKTSGMELNPENYTMNWLKNLGYADWQTRLLSSITDCRIFNHGVSCEDGSDGNTAMGNFRPNDVATRADVFEFMMYTSLIDGIGLPVCSGILDDFQTNSLELDDTILDLEKLFQSCIPL